METKINLNDLSTFDCFLNREVGVITGKRAPGVYGPEKTYELERSNPVIANLTRLSQDYKFNLRIWLPDTIGTMDLDVNRLNVYIEEDPDGKFRVKHLSVG